MTNQHPITPPPELKEQALAQQIADQELEACYAWLKAYGYSGTVIDLRAALCPEPPSLKGGEQK
jgi:hypothetical protein